MLKFRLTLVLFSPILVLAACADHLPSQTNTLDAISSSDESLPTPTQAAEPGSSNRILSLDVGRCAIPDPAVDAWDTGAGIGSPPLVTEIHAGLTKLTDDPSSPVALELAESFSKGPNGTTYTFKLRPNLTFSDGTPLTAADVKASWERALRLARTGGYAFKILRPIRGAEDILQDVSTELEGVNVIDDRTIEVHLSKPNHSFETSVAHPVAFVLKMENVGHWDGYWSNDVDPHPVDALENPPPAVALHSDLLPVGAGPFKLTVYEAYGDVQRCVLSRNNRYWGEQTHLDYVVLENHATQVIPVGFPSDATARLFSQLSIDMDPWVLTELTDEHFDDLDSVEGVSRISTPIEIAVFALNDHRHPLNVDEVRRTLLNSADLVKRLYGSEYPRPNRIVPEQLQGAVGDVQSIRFDGSTSIPYELRTDGLPGVFYILDDDVVMRFGFHSLLADITDEWWSEYGINLRMVHRSSDQFAETAQAHGYDARLWQTTIQTPDPGHLFASFAEPFGERQGRKWDALTPMFTELETAVDEATRREIYARIEQAMLDDYLGITLFWSVGWMPVRVQPDVHGFTGVTFPRSMFHNVWMDDTAPERPIP